MSLGTPVVVSDIPIFREIGGEAALYAPAADPVAVASAIRRLEDPRSGRRARARRGPGGEFSWDRSADALLAALEERRRLGVGDGHVKLVLDLHDIYNRHGDIDRALHAIIEEAVAKKAPLVEIIPGKGTGALKTRVLRFLAQPEIKPQYHRVEKDSKNFGRVFVHFRTK